MRAREDADKFKVDKGPRVLEAKLGCCDDDDEEEDDEDDPDLVLYALNAFSKSG